MKGKSSPSKQKSARRRRVSSRLIDRFGSAAALIVGSRLLVLLVTWYPGDETIRASSESPLRFMFSRSGISFGNRISVHFSTNVRLEAGERAIQKTKREYTVQGTIAKHPTWHAHLNVTREAEQTLEPPKPNGKGLTCFFRIHHSEPRMTLFDDGQVFVHDLAGEMGKGHRRTEGLHARNFGVKDIGMLRCSHFRMMSLESFNALHHNGAVPIAATVTPEGTAGRVLLMNSATTLTMLSEYHQTLLNHQSYAEYHHYAYILALVKPSELEGRSGKFAKHLAIGKQLAQKWLPGRPSWDTICHADLDAWFATWAPFSAYADMWPHEKDLLFADTGQIWLNTGLMCARPTRWALRFFDMVVNAVFSGVEHDDKLGHEWEKVHRHAKSTRSFFGFKRDQPAVWHVLSNTWAKEAEVPYLGQGCEVWHDACNPDENPIECWHWCHWSALQRAKYRVATHASGTDGSQGASPAGSWRGLHSINLLTRVHLVPQEGVVPGGANLLGRGETIPLPMHRMCLRSCYSALARGAMSICSLLTAGGSTCFPRDVDKMSLCDGRGCLLQMVDRRGGWIKHSGHQHWRDVLPICIPTSFTEALSITGRAAAMC